MADVLLTLFFKSIKYVLICHRKEKKKRILEEEYIYMLLAKIILYICNNNKIPICLSVCYYLSGKECSRASPNV